MKKKTGIILLVIVVICVAIAIGCFSIYITMNGYKKLNEERTDPETISYVQDVKADGYRIGFKLPEDYRQKDHDSFDIFYSNDESNFGVFLYYSEDMEEFDSLQEYYETQNQSVLSARSDVKVMSEQKDISTDTMKISRIVYSAYKEGSNNHYFFYLVESKEDPTVLAWVMLNATDSIGRRNEKVYDEIVKTAYLLPDTEGKQ